jgi:excisionase family DNA binding protein
MITVNQTAEHLDVSAKTIRRWIDEGKLPHHRLGRQIRISELDLIEFIERHRRA